MTKNFGQVRWGWFQRWGDYKVEKFAVGVSRVWEKEMPGVGREVLKK